MKRMGDYAKPLFVNSTPKMISSQVVGQRSPYKDVNVRKLAFDSTKPNLPIYLAIKGVSSHQSDRNTN
jgi:hypothetical protein